VAQPIVCSTCGAKIRAERGRCPRCRAAIAAPDPKLAAAASRRFRQIAAGLVAAFVLVTGVLWLLRDPAPAEAPASRGRVADPLGDRRTAVEPAPQAPDYDEQEAIEAPRPFMDAPAHAAAAYTRGDYESALDSYLDAIERNPQDAESLSNLGQVLVRLERPAEALEYFERAVDLLPGRWAYQFNHARALGLTGDWPQAVEAYRRAEALFPDDYATAFNLGQALGRLGDHAAAVEAYQRAIALDPGDPSFRMALGITYERLQKPAEAAAAYREALRLAPDAPDAETVSARIAELLGQDPGKGPGVE
jgi:tetratricopeptide (TPR) repeat protein